MQEDFPGNFRDFGGVKLSENMVFMCFEVYDCKHSLACGGPGTLMPETLVQNPLMPGSFWGYPPPPGEVLVTVKADLCAQKFAA